ncbi:hypothetical protein WA026_012591 [Henosepilachna vigintioctopunctata]|uniref:C2H2-type domain-containing protein n=1 Tax=Henosepilachna vigintioctopunctata TaxID=420089 RepID=A0AAW1U6L3_9CUCU
MYLLKNFELLDISSVKMETARICSDKGESPKIFGPLLFEDKNSDHLNAEIACLLCDDIFNLNLSLALFLRHIFEVHHVVIEDVQNIPNLPEYLKYWKDKFKTKNIEEIVPTLRIDSTDRTYHLLSSLLREDKELRHKLNLKYTLHVQEFERCDANYVKPCLFCKLQFEGTRLNFLEHLSITHNFQLGNPQNLVYVEELIDKIENKMKELKCIYCEKTFPERQNQSKNNEYDKFYIVNYLEIDKNWQDLEKECDKYALSKDSELNSDEEFSDWSDDEDKITCLFCNDKEINVNALCLHMTKSHNFNFEKLTDSLDFYQKVKLVNYIRRQIHNFRCPFCDKAFENDVYLSAHLIKEEHFRLPEITVFDQPEFYFPTYENDAFLYFIDDLVINE